MSADTKIFKFEARLKQSEPLLQYTKQLQAQVSDSKTLSAVNINLIFMLWWIHPLYCACGDF